MTKDATVIFKDNVLIGNNEVVLDSFWPRMKYSKKSLKYRYSNSSDMEIAVEGVAMVRTHSNGEECLK